MRFFILTALLGLATSSSLQASTLWRCEKDGVPSFVQTKLAGQVCRAVSQAPRAPSARVSDSSPVPVLASPVNAPRGLPPLPPGLSSHAPRSLDLPTALPGVSAVEIPLPGIPSASPLPRPVVSTRRSSGAASRGAIYRRVINGVVEFSSKPAQGANIAARFTRQCYACGAPSSVSFQAVPLDTLSYAPIIAQEAQKHALDPAWVRAVIHAESNFNPQAISPKGAQGLMQLMPATAQRFGVNTPFEPAQNIAGGVEYLAWLLKRFKGDHRLATAAYNAGEGAVDRYSGVPPFSETRLYVERVSTLRERYRASQ